MWFVVKTTLFPSSTVNIYDVSMMGMWCSINEFVVWYNSCLLVVDHLLLFNTIPWCGRRKPLPSLLPVQQSKLKSSFSGTFHQLLWEHSLAFYEIETKTKSIKLIQISSGIIDIALSLHCGVVSFIFVLSDMYVHMVTLTG